MDHAERAGMSDEAVRSKTGRTWKQWTRVLDAAGAAERSHAEIARLLREEHGLSGWWSQAVSGGYERIRGLREKNQRRGGGFDVNKSKTCPVPVAELYAAFGARRRRRWMGDVDVTVKTATRERSMRLIGEDGLPVDVTFLDKGEAKSAVQLQHRGLPSRAAADAAREGWTARLAALAKLLS